MDVLFLAFSNSRTAPLTTLQQEDDQLYRILSPGALNQKYLLHRDSYATLETLPQYLAQYRAHIRMFLFSGHAGQHQLIVDDVSASATGIAHLLGQCPKLQVVFLNGCSTKGQVDRLIQAGVPAVIATSAEIDDAKAKLFSTRFFQSMIDMASVQEAFELAKGELLTSYPDIDVNSATELPSWSTDEEKESTWGLYTKTPNASVLSWKLPLQQTIVEDQNYVPNEQLIDTLMTGLAPFDEDIKKMNADEELGLERSILDKREAILKALPHPVSEQLRKLLVDGGPGTANTVFFNKAGLPRFEQIVTIFSTQFELLAYVMLAQLWELFVKKSDVVIEQEALDIIRTFMLTDAAGKGSHDYGKLVETIRKILDTYNEPYFVPELKELAQRISEDDQLSNAISFLHQQHQKLDERSIGADEAKQLCPTAEQKLSLFMKHMGWFAKYTLVSIKAIDVLKYRHLKEPRYKARMVRLIQRFVGLAEDQEISDSLMDCDSVLMMKAGGKEFLNLTPFVIDENAFDEKASIAKLYFFDRYDKASGAFLFKHVYKPKDVPLIVRDQKHFRILKAQFNAFSEQLFNQEMAAL